MITHKSAKQYGYTLLMFSFTSVVLHKDAFSLKLLQLSKNTGNHQVNGIGSNEEAILVADMG